MAPRLPVIRPDAQFIRARAEKIRALPVAVARYAAVGGAEEFAIAVEKLARNVATVWRDVIHSPITVTVLPDRRRRVSHRIGFDLCNQLAHEGWRIFSFVRFAPGKKRNASNKEKKSHDLSFCKDAGKYKPIAE